LYSLGLAIGLTAIDPADPSSARGAGIGTGIWSLVSPLIALFVGGLVASRTAGIVDRVGAIIHGGVLWSLTTVVGLLVLGFALSSIVSGVARLGGGLAKAGGQAASQAAQGGSAPLGLDADAMLAPLNRQLESEGKPAVTADQLQAALQTAVQRSLQQGRFDRETFTRSLSEQTSMSQAQAQDIASDVERRAGATVDQAGATALKSADVTGRAFWGVFAALLLGLVSAILGAAVGVSKRQRLAAGEPVKVSMPEPGGPEVHPGRP
jgi:hypothetical protein